MKKLMIYVFMIFMSTITFAQNYEANLAKAKEYEEKKEFVYALGYYYDAMNDENALPEARQNFNSISTKLSKGPSGLELSMWDDPKEAWRNVILEFYKYFTEFSPYEFYYYDKLEQRELDYKNKTATYLMKYDFKLSNKFKAISNCLTNSDIWDNDDEAHYYYLSKYTTIVNSYKTYGGNGYYISSPVYEWELNERKNANLIPNTNVYFNSIDEERYIKKIQEIELASENEVEKAGINTYNPILKDIDAVLKIKEKYNVQIQNLFQEYEDKLHSEILQFHKKTGIAMSVPATRYRWSINLENFSKPLVLASFSSFEDSSNYVMFGKYLPYDFEFGIYDKDNKLLLKGFRQIAYASYETTKEDTTQPTKSIYYFSGITEQIMKSIQNGEYLIKPTAMYLNFGVFRTKGYDKNATEQEIRNSYLKNTAEIKQDLNKVRIINESERQREREKKETLRRNYSQNTQNLNKIIYKYIDNSISLGFKVDSNFTITEIQKKSPADKGGLKKGNTIELPYTEIPAFNDDEIIQSLNLKAKFENEIIDDAELISYVKLYLNNEKHLVKHGDIYCIVPLEKKESLSLTIHNGKKTKIINLSVE